MISHSEKITKLMGAMLKVQGMIDGVRTDSKNPAFKSTYASLEIVVDTIRPACQAHGLVVMQAPANSGKDFLVLETLIVHAESGEWIRCAAELPLAKADPQGAGSAITYAERYSLMALFNLPPVDDDGNDASRRPEPPRPTQQAPAVGDEVAEHLGRLIRKCGSVDALEALKTDQDFKRQFNSLPLAHQATVGAVIKTVRTKLEAA